MGSWASILLGLAVFGVGSWALGAAVPCEPFSIPVQLSGSDERLANWLGDCPPDLGAGRLALWMDLIYMAGYGLTLSSVLRRWWPLLRAEWLVAMARFVIGLPILAAGLDLIENLLSLAVLEVTNGRFAYAGWDGWPIVIAIIAWSKIIALVTTAVTALLVAPVVEWRTRVTRTPTSNR